MTATTTELSWPTTGDEANWMTGRPPGSRAGARLLDVDPDLGRGLHPHVRDRVAPVLRVGIETLECGPWDATALPCGPKMLGLLVVDGLIIRDVSIQHRSCAELLGPGDLLRPWLDPLVGGPDLLSGAAEWHVVDGPARLAVIDGRAGELIGRLPSVMGELLDRTLGRARSLQLQLALTQVHGIPQRLELLLWHFADRWGRVTPEGVVLPLNLTHEMLGRLIGARRPSVTTALCALRERGAVVRSPEGWLLRQRASEDVLPLMAAA